MEVTVVHLNKEQRIVNTADGLMVPYCCAVVI